MSTTLERLEYGFDRDSRRTWRRRALTTGEDQAYGYDGLSQVVEAARGNLNVNATAIGGVPAEAQGWDYDPTGNWRGYETKANGSVVLAQTRVHDKGNRLTQIAGAPNPVLLDRAGRMREVSPDAGGNWNQAQQVKWDAWSRVTEVRRRSDGAVLGSYSYDGLSRRTTQSVGGTTTHTYYSDAWRPLEERLNNQTTAARQYYWGARHRDDLVRRDRATTSGGPLNETRYVLMDYFSPAALVDASGAVKERYAFSAFGVRRILTPAFGDRATSECDFTFAFQGQFLDSESGYLNYGYRYYSPHLGRWLSKDPIAEAGGLNLYDMVANGAVNATDHLGLLSIGEGVDTSLDEFTKRLLGPCGSSVGGQIPPLVPPPPPQNPPPKTPPPKTPPPKNPNDPNNWKDRTKGGKQDARGNSNPNNNGSPGNGGIDNDILLGHGMHEDIALEALVIGVATMGVQALNAMGNGAQNLAAAAMPHVNNFAAQAAAQIPRAAGMLKNFDPGRVGPVGVTLSGAYRGAKNSFSSGVDAIGTYIRAYHYYSLYR